MGWYSDKLTKAYKSPLAVEDCLHVFDKSARSKSDWFANHLCVLLYLANNGYAHISKNRVRFIRLIFFQACDGDESTSDSDEGDAIAMWGSTRGASQHQMHKIQNNRKRTDTQRTNESSKVEMAPKDATSTSASLIGSESSKRPARPVRQSAASLPFTVSRTTGRASRYRAKALGNTNNPSIRHDASDLYGSPRYRQSDSRRDAQSIFAKAWRTLIGVETLRDNGNEDESLPNKRSARPRRRKSSDSDPGPNNANAGREEADIGIPSQQESGHGTDRKIRKGNNIHGKDGGTAESDYESDDPSYAARRVIRNLTRKYRVGIERQQLSMFLTRDGTLVSIFSKDGGRVIPSIVTRLQSKNTLLRNSEDASMLMQALFDVCIDKSLEITDNFGRKLNLVNAATTPCRPCH